MRHNNAFLSCLFSSERKKRMKAFSSSPSTSTPSKRRRVGGGPNDKEEADGGEELLSPVVVFAHGAGAPSSSEWMVRWKKMLSEALHAVEVITFDYPYISGGKRRAPPKAEKLVEFHADAVRKAAEKYPGNPIILVGKSMGSRVSCMVASEEGINASAIVCLGYPLKGINGAIRDEVLLKLSIPVMFVQGTKDALCPLEKLDIVREKMTSATELHVIDGGDHSFKIGKKHLQFLGSTQEDAEGLAVGSVAGFVEKIIQYR